MASKKTCRVCLCEDQDQLVDIFKNGMDLIYSNVTGLQIDQNDAFPKQICFCCFGALTNFAKLKKTAEVSLKIAKEKHPAALVNSKPTPERKRKAEESVDQVSTKKIGLSSHTPQKTRLIRNRKVTAGSTSLEIDARLVPTKFHNITISGEYKSVKFKIRSDQPIKTMMKAYCKYAGFDHLEQLIWCSGGERIYAVDIMTNKANTPAFLGFEDEVLIDVFTRRTGPCKVCLKRFQNKEGTN